MSIAELETETPPIDNLQCWHALYTRHQHEKQVAQSLSIKGHDVFLPIYQTAHRWRDRTKLLWMPLFPCYVFLRGGMDRQLQLLTTPGIVGILQSCGRPVIVPRDQIDAVRRIVDSSLSVEPHPFLSCGNRVRVKVGPLAGVEGILVRKKGTSRLIVSMDLLGRSTAVEIDISCVERIGPRPLAVQMYSNIDPTLNHGVWTSQG
jgi:transcription antitermination factor NusG